MTELATPSAGYSITFRLQIVNRPGMFAKVVQEVGSANASLAEVTLISRTFAHTVRDVTVLCRSEEHQARVLSKLPLIEGVELLFHRDDTFVVHEGGKMFVTPKQELKTADELARAYTPGVARVCLHIARNPDDAKRYTIKKNTIAVVSDGSAVLGLGNIGARAAMPVMEGKAVLFKQFAGVDAFPICLETQDTEEIIRTVKAISPSFGGINLEDISAPRCFEIERRLEEELDIPVFHDDQHGTAVVLLAGLLNAVKIVGKKLSELKVVINGFGAGGVACARILVDAGVRNIIPCDTNGIVYRGRPVGMNPVKEDVLSFTNPDNVKGSLSDAMKGADLFVGVSVAGALKREMVSTMNKDAMVFALANPIPEIMPDEIKDIVRIIATGRSDYANQVNNVLCFPGIFRGALDSGARNITREMKLAAAYAIASCVDGRELNEDHIIPNVFNSCVAPKVADAVRAAVKLG